LKLPLALAAIAIAVGIAACDRPADKSASAKPELTPTTPAIGAPPATPAPVMPPPASAVLGQPSDQSASQTQTSAAGTPVDSGAKPDPALTAQGSDPSGKEPMTKQEESTAMPKPAQANDHSTTATDGKQ
jgi:hypothetical protein